MLRWLGMILRKLGFSRNELDEALARHSEAAKENEDTADRVTQKKEAEKNEHDELTFVLERIARRIHRRGDNNK